MVIIIYIYIIKLLKVKIYICSCNVQPNPSTYKWIYNNSIVPGQTTLWVVVTLVTINYVIYITVIVLIEWVSIINEIEKKFSCHNNVFFFQIWYLFRQYCYINAETIHKYLLPMCFQEQKFLPCMCMHIEVLSD